MSALKIGIVGGGAAGFFAAIRCAGLNPDAEVVILERGKTPLEKVRISGGGRCNVTHACFDPRELTQHYPRGGRELLGPFMRFGPEQTVAWFEARGTPLKAETDGRMFPQSDDSMSVVQCLRREAERLGVILRLQARVERIAQEQGGWVLGVGGDAHKLFFQKILIAAGSSTAIWDLLAALGHRIVPPVPSLFTFNTRDTRLRDLAGISAPETEVAIPNLRLSARGPLLVTHRGLSGPAILRGLCANVTTALACKLTGRRHARMRSQPLNRSNPNMRARPFMPTPASGCPCVCGKIWFRRQAFHPNGAGPTPAKPACVRWPLRSIRAFSRYTAEAPSKKSL